MDSAVIKLELMRQLLSIVDAKTLQKVANFFKEEVVVEADEISDEEYAAFEEAIAKHERGEEKFHTEEESIRLIRSGYKE